MKTKDLDKLVRFIISVSFPFVACVLQWFFWPLFQPLIWFLFYPAIFASSWLGGLAGGITATSISVVLAIYFFIPPQFTFLGKNFANLSSVIVFMIMGVLFSLTHDRLQKASRQIAAALQATRTANDQLQAANAKITGLYDKLRELDELKSQFFANVSHELRTPLTLILGPLEKHLQAGDLSDDARHDLQVMDRNARLLYRHVSDLLDVSKLDSGKMQLQYTQADLAHLTRLVASHFDVLAAEKQIGWTVNAPSTLPAQFDSAQCERVLLNLLSNAFKFTPNAGAITLTLRAQDAQALFEIQDSGPGVLPEMRDAIFERFRQVDGGAARHFGGTGLGLAIVKELVTLHGGTISVADAPGGGALFTMTLPLAAPTGALVKTTVNELDQEIDRQMIDELRAVPIPATPTDAPPNAPLVLVVEDNPDMNAFIVEILSAHYRVVTAFDGDQGLARALETHPDLILSDVMMPGLSGDQMVIALRRHANLQSVPIVMLTAKADDTLRVNMLRHGVQDYIVKPFSADELLARVDGLVQRHKQSEGMQLRLAAIVESSDDAIIGKTLDGLITSWNHGAEHLFGYSAEQAIGQAIIMLFPPERLNEENEILAKLMRGERVAHFETVRIRQDGQRIDISATISPIKDETGAIIGISKIARDISERKRVERAILASEKRFRDIAENAQEWIWEVDAEGHYTYASQMVEKILGYTPEEIRQKCFYDLFHPDDRETLRTAALTAFAAKQPLREFINRNVHKNGETIWLTTSAVPMLDEAGNLLGYRGADADITARKRADENLQASEERYRGLFEHMVEGYAYCQMIFENGAPQDWVYLAVNPAFENLTGLKGVAGKRVSQVITGIRETDSELFSVYARVATTGKTERFEMLVKALDMWFAVSVYSPALGFFVAVFDVITERKRAEALQNAVYQIAQASNLVESLNDLFPQIQNIISEVMPAENFYIALYDQARNCLSFPYSIDQVDKTYEGEEIEPGKSLTAYVLRTGKSLLCTESLHEQLVQQGEVERVGIPSLIWLGVPLIVRSTTIGVMVVQHYSNPNVFGIREQRVLEFVSSQVAIAIERKRAEEALRESEYFFKESQRAAFIGSYKTDFRKGFWESSEVLDQIFGIDSHYNRSIQGWLDLVHPDDQDRMNQYLQKEVIAKHKPFEMEYRITRRADGETRWVLGLGQVAFDPQGAVISLIGTIQDITERKHAETRILRLNRLYAMLSQINQAIVRTREVQTLFEQVCRVIIEYGKYRMAWIGLIDEASQMVKPAAYAGEEQGYLTNLQVTYRNEPSAQGPTGTAIREGRCVICQDIANNPLMQLWRAQALERGYQSSAAVPIRQQGQVIGALTVYAADPDGFDAEDAKLLDEIGSDIAFALETMQIETRRKLAEDQLRASESRYRLISENSADVIWVLDPLAGKFTYVSPSAQKLRGYTPTEIMAQPVAESLTPESLRLVNASIAARLPAFMAKGTETESHTDEVDQPRKDGSSVHTEVTTTYLFDASGRVEIIGVSRDITERKQHEHELEAVANMSAAMRQAHTRVEMLPIIANQVANSLNVATVALLFSDKQTDDYVIEYAQGIWASDTGKHLPRTAKIFRYVIEQGKPYLTNDLPNDPNFFLRDSIRDLRAMVEIPLITHDVMIGFLAVASRDVFTEPDVRVLTAIADIAANAIQRAALHEQTEQDAASLAQAYDTTLEGWAHALELRDQETEGHTRRVAQLTIQLARAMGIRESELEPIRRGALLHDIGKMGIPDSVLLKPGTLNEREWEIMRRHPEYAYKLLEPIGYLHPALDIPYCHHEKWDGTGYPRGLKGDAIPLPARIFAIVDVWDALCSDRPYRAAWSAEQARVYIRAETGKHFDPQVAEQFLKLVEQA